MSDSGNQQRALQRILALASTDAHFRQRLLTEPRAAIHDVFGITIPSTFRIKFVERDPDVDALIVLPDPKPADGALTDQELEWVSGGYDADDDTWAEGPSLGDPDLPS
jgi:hypothetical protein